MVRCGVALLVVALGCSRAAEPAPTESSDALPAAPPAGASPPTLVPKPEAPVPPAASPTAPAAASAPSPTLVDVRSIGMHIGGGPNDDANKAPLLASIAPHHEALGRCWASLPNRPRVEFGIDARVPGKGGLAKIERPRSTVNDASFIACALAVFATIEFLPPKSGLDTVVSTSVRLSPTPAR